MSVTIPSLPEDLPVSQPRWIGKPMRRIEDPLLVTGQAEYTDNLKFPGMLYGAFLRSPYAHARIVRIDTSKAEALPGVHAIVTGEDVERETNILASMPPGFTAYSLAVGKVRFVGEPVVAVAADSRYIAEDAVDLIEVEYDPLPAVVDAREAVKPETIRVHESQESNVIYHRDFVFGDVEEAFAHAAYVARESYRFPRISANPMETNGCIAQWNLFADEVTFWGSFQGPAFTVGGIADALRLPTNRVRLVGQPHGGSFGSKFGLAHYMAPIALLSKKADGRPVKWIEDRIEHLRAGFSDAWERYYDGELAFDENGKATAFRVRCVDNHGAYAELLGPGMAVKPLVEFTGCYEIPACEYDVTAVATNKNPQGAYRGFGPPPNTLLLEWLMDDGAKHFGLDPAEIRYRNFIPPEKFPYTLPTGNEYDSGRYAAALDELLEMSNYEELRRQQEAARKEGRLVGLGLVTTIETGVFGFTAYSHLTGGVGPVSTPEGAVVRIDAMGNIIAEVGFPWEGQGQHTFITYLLADYFGVDPERVTVRTVDTQSTPPGFGPGGSRLAAALSGAVLGAADRVRTKLIKMAAALLEADPSDVELRDGNLGVRGVPESTLPLAQVAAAMIYRSDLMPPDIDGSPEASYVWTAPDRTLPDEQGRAKSYLTAANAAHLVEVEVDPETGVVDILGYWIADDCGTRLNPSMVEGMIQGGLAQGLGAALLEEYTYDENGERLNSTFMDYLLPTIQEVPHTEKRSLTTPSPFTPLGAKGTGEGAIHTTPSALFCAVNDALAPIGATIRELPMSPSRVWAVIQEAQAGTVSS